MQKRDVDLYVWGRKHDERPQTPKPLKDCAKSSRNMNICLLEAWCWYTSFGRTHTRAHSETSVSVITALLVAASSFPQQVTTEKATPRCFFCTRETTSIRWESNV